MWKTGGALGLAVALCATGVQAQSVGQQFVIEPPSVPFGGEQVAARNEPLLVQMARSERHLRLLAPVQTQIKRAWRSDAVYFPAHAVLHSASVDGELFCGVMETYSSACFEDTDHDGRLDVIYDAVITPGSWNYLAFHKDGQVTPGTYTAPQRLSPPVPYVLTGDAEALTSPLKIYLSSNYSSSSPDRIVRVELEALLGPKRSGAMRASSRPYKMDPKVGVRTSVYGAVIDVLGFTPEGGVRYRVMRPISSAPTQFSISPF